MSSAEPAAFPFAESTTVEGAGARYRQLRQNQGPLPVRLPHGGTAWLVSRYEDVESVLRDPRFSRELAGDAVSEVMPSLLVRTSLLSLDAIDHDRIRACVAPLFTREAAEALRPRIRKLVRARTDAFPPDAHPFDGVAAYSLPVPVDVISEVLGVPAADREQFYLWADLAISSDALPAAVYAAHDDLLGYFATAPKQGADQPSAGLRTGLARMVDAGRLSHEAAVSLLPLLLVAGYETSVGQLGFYLLDLATRPEHHAALRQHPDRIPEAVTTYLRTVPYNVIGGALARVAREAVQIGSVTIAADETVIPSVEAANMQTLSMSSRPDHLSFGAGLHACLGSWLAQLELEEAVFGIASGFESIELAVELEELRLKEGSVVRSLQTLPLLARRTTDH
ncbi:hypothetical protein [Streptomyces sp. NPDC058701]|uniref:hypothetical protein n=1 Tax=Streptomyces sp. NPDC058701 TaxID=3346608 RepID=UPI0036598A49